MGRNLVLGTWIVGLGSLGTACSGAPETSTPTDAPLAQDEQAVPADVESTASDAWLELVKTRIEAGSYRFFARSSGYFAQNEEEGLRAELSERGVHLSERDRPEQQLSLRFAAWGRAGQTKAVNERPFQLGACMDAARVDEEGRCVQRLEADHGAVREWWSNRPGRFEQGFTISQRPPGTAQVELEIAVEGAAPRGTASNLVWLVFPDGSRLGYEELHVSDATGRVLDASLRVSGERIVIAFDDSAAVYPVIVDPAVTSIGKVQDSPATLFGLAINGAGDVNGDGFDDVLVGAPGYDTHTEDGGRALLYYGSPSGMSSTAAWFRDGTWPYGNYGYAVATAGDINGDGYSDVLVGEPQANTAAERGGAAYIYLGSSSGVSTTAAWIASGTFAYGWFGKAVASAGDVNGDGKSDILIGAPNTSNGVDREGRASLYLSSSGALDTTADWTREGNQAVAFFGHSVAGVGDVNGDGFSDAVIGAYYYGPADEGYVWGYLGRAGGTLGNVVWTISGTQAGSPLGYGEQLGQVVAPAGDMNGDGYADVLIAGPGWDTPTRVNAGRVMVHYSSASGYNARSSVIATGTANGWLGSSMSTVGDIDGDGYTDVFVSENNSTSKLFYGPEVTPFGYFSEWWESDRVANGGDLDGDGLTEGLLSNLSNGTVESMPKGQKLPSQPTVDLSNGGSRDEFAKAYAICDANADGLSDLIAGLPYFDDGQPGAGKVNLYAGTATSGEGSGLTSTVRFTTSGGVIDANFGHGLACGDFNGDGFPDLAVGSPLFDNGQINEGRVSIYNGQSSYFNPMAARLLESNKANSSFSRTMAVGDVNGDGFADLVVGASSETNDQTNEGRVYVYHGSSSGIGATANRVLEGTVASASFGSDLALADVNRDGFDDLVVGAPGHSGGQTNEGRVYAYFGSSTGLPATAAWGAESERASSRFGRSVALTDVNGDGYVDLIVGAFTYSNPEASEGRIFYYPASSSGFTSATWYFEGDQEFGNLGTDIAGGDWNNDGFGDFVVAFPGNRTVDGFYRGAVRLFVGSASGIEPSPRLSYERGGEGTLPDSVSLSGDFNGDGLSDLGLTYTDIGKAGHFSAFGLPRSGGRLTVLRPGTSVPLQPGNKSPSRAVDVRLFARSPFGRTRAKVQVEVKPRGTAFNGQGLVTSSSWVDTGVNGAPVTASVTGLAANTAYHLRARLRWDPSRGMVGSNSRWYYAGTLGQRASVHFRTP